MSALLLCRTVLCVTSYSALLCHTPRIHKQGRLIPVRERTRCCVGLASGNFQCNLNRGAKSVRRRKSPGHTSSKVDFRQKEYPKVNAGMRSEAIPLNPFSSQGSRWSRAAYESGGGGGGGGAVCSFRV